MADASAKDMFGRLKNTDSPAFMISKSGSTISVELFPKAQTTKMKAKVKATSPSIGGTFSYADGELTFVITNKKGTLSLNSVLKTAVKVETGAPVLPNFVESADCEDADKVVKKATGQETEGGESESFDLGGLDGLDQLSGLDGLDDLAALDAPSAPPVDADALDMLDGLDGLDEVESQDQTPPPDTKGSFVRAQQARLLWNSTRKSAQGALDALAKAIVSEYPDEAATAKGVESALSELSEDLIDALDDLLNAKGLGDPDKQATAVKGARAKALKAVTEYRTFVQGSELLAHLDENPFGVGPVTKPLLGTLAEIEKGINA